MMGTPKFARLLVGAAALLQLGCPAPMDDDDATSTSTSTSAESSGSASNSASNTSATAATDPITASETTAAADSGTGTPMCDPDTCESLDVETCQACPLGGVNDSCAVLYGWLWTEEQGEWCTGQSVPLGCKTNGICFDYSPTACDGTGQMYYLDNICPEIDFATLGLELCDPPSETQGMCPG